MNDKHIPPSVGEFAVEESWQLQARITRLEDLLDDASNVLANVDADMRERIDLAGRIDWALSGSRQWQAKAIQEGIESAERGELTPASKVREKWEAKQAADAGAVEVVAWSVTANKRGITQQTHLAKRQDEAEHYADHWRGRGCDVVIRVLCDVDQFTLARTADRAEIERLTNKITEFNASFEQYDREWQVSYGLIVEERDALRAELAEVRKDAEIARLQETCNGLDGQNDALAEENDQLRAELAEVGKALEQAVDDIESWGAYASAYAQKKHGLSECVAKYRAAIQNRLSAQQQGEEE